MDDTVRQIVREAITKIIQDTISEENIERSLRLHHSKIHFVPAKYRVIGGLLQSLNIKFGNFIEKLIALIVERDSNVEALQFSGEKVRMSITEETDFIIDRYITSRQLPDSPDTCDELFEELLNQIVRVERENKGKRQVITRDVDALFRSRSGEIVFLEIKYNDDHDTGKFVDINRKFIKTYAGLVNLLEIDEVSQLKPILYYFNPIKRWAPIYVPSSNIYRGSKLFDEYFEIGFSDIDAFLRNLGDDKDIMRIFDELYRSVRNK